ncbi:hypothetical protein PHLGIDRAFT_90915 [Phlebiopsis gigantea 11061_1 CR5-6]|uniref:Uncharacterized protein n=1 Tax=Phlebiopsis gigantea (strain 11061_1 CR5-6) TaxID=745531 RepID=A0A0C3RX79_PHLG1|nr:hypothetical protein PHLGIDRAFT_90915 [Phlebiopsis gigantea 11061_1 CR5-6]
MFSRFSSIIKPRNATSTDDESSNDAASKTDVVGRVKELHPNMSIFQPDASEVPFPAPSPPGSPSRDRRSAGMLKRMSRIPHDDTQATLPRFGLSKVKSSLASLRTGSNNSLGRASAEQLARESQDQDRPSTDSLRTPITPIAESKFPAEGRFGSLRSILKPKDAPGTGQSVRFFSRDAYRVLTPEQTSASETDDAGFLNRIQRSAPSSSRPDVQQVFSPPPPVPPPKEAEPATPGLASMMMPISPPSMANIFNASGDELPTIASGLGAPLLDCAVEISDTDEHMSMSISMDSAEGEPSMALTSSPTVKLGPVQHDRSHSFSFGQTVFRSAATGAVAESSPAKSLSPTGRGRSLSDTIFASMIHSSSSAPSDPKRPETDIDDTSQAMVAFHPPGPEKDPFAANATTYYGPGTMMPPSPPQSNHTRTASREEDLIWSLRTQLALQSELCAQYEVDLSAKDELVDMLNARLSESNTELERRKGMLRTWRKRVGELEKCVKGLEGEVDRSREESVDRSVMDEASGEALRMLHRRIGELERERKDGDQRERALREELAAANAQVEQTREELQTREQNERELEAGIQAAREEMEQMKHVPEAQALHHERERHQSARSTWEEERAALVASNDTLRNEHLLAQSQLTALREDIARKEDELGILKAELEAQWEHTERTTEDMEKLQQQRNSLMNEVEALHEKLAGVGSDHEDRENKRLELENEIQEVWAMRDDLEKEREELEQHLRAEQDHAEELTKALQEREDRVGALEQERQYAYDSVSRLQENIRQRDAELSGYAQRIREREAEAEGLREGLTRQKREHARIVDEQSRKISEVVAREVEARATMERIVREKAEDDVAASALTERVSALTEELERLRKQVHQLQQESADKEVKLLQAAKQRSQDKEDMQGLNIALDAKQQELELLKRRAGVKVSPGQAPSTKAPARRESSIFGTPSVGRPSSVMSDVSSTKDAPPTVTRSSLSRSIRPNGSAVNAPTKRFESSSVKGRSSLGSSSVAPSHPPSASSSLARVSSVTPLARPHSRTASSLESLRNKTIGSSRDVGNSSMSERDEKENISSSSATPIAKRPTRRLSVALPA